MRRYADPVEVRQGPVEAYDDPVERAVPREGPEQFLWRGRLWKVRAVLAHWVETGPWWQSAGRARGDRRSDDRRVEVAPRHRSAPLGDLLTERELWRVEAGRAPPAIAPRRRVRRIAGSSTSPSTGPTAAGSSSAARTERPTSQPVRTTSRDHHEPARRCRRPPTPTSPGPRSR